MPFGWMGGPLAGLREKVNESEGYGREAFGI